MKYKTNFAQSVYAFYAAPKNFYTNNLSFVHFLCSRQNLRRWKITFRLFFFIHFVYLCVFEKKSPSAFHFPDWMQVNVGNWTENFPLEFFFSAALLVSHDLNQEIVTHDFVICYTSILESVCVFVRACMLVISHYHSFLFHKLVSNLKCQP